MRDSTQLVGQLAHLEYLVRVALEDGGVHLEAEPHLLADPHGLYGSIIGAWHSHEVVQLLWVRHVKGDGDADTTGLHDLQRHLLGEECAVGPVDRT